MADPVDGRGTDPATGTAEGETPERPSTAELGRPGTPSAGEEHGAGHDDHDAGHDDHRPGHDEHGDGEHGKHAEPRLGPIDWPAWGASALGVAIAGVMAVLFYLAVVPR